jgi:hypothetical protein
MMEAAVLMTWLQSTSTIRGEMDGLGLVLLVDLTLVDFSMNS